MTTPLAAGRRYLTLADGPTLTYLDIALLLRARLGPLGTRIATTEVPGDVPLPLTIHNDRAKRELDFRPRPAETTLLDTVTGLYDQGLLREDFWRLNRS
ncbi:hypothetical protein [uncultured Deinococcus sp.]|uniref:hypothetical protein n=1 Tax=uncultured Deinococcus sp. TaxID=158789 RepID=UPI0025FAFF4A|nr:hypothetical protein [uncultured Deinococcus sp.]